MPIWTKYKRNLATLGNQGFEEHRSKNFTFILATILVQNYRGIDPGNIPNLLDDFSLFCFPGQTRDMIASLPFALPS